MMEIGEQPANDPEKLLQLIKNGDAEMLLAEGELGKGFNELINLDLIIIEEGKVKLTQLGEDAIKKGIETVIPVTGPTSEVKPVLNTTPEVKTKLHRKLWLLAGLLLLFAMTLMASQLLS